jgi:hypothetical protein
MKSTFRAMLVLYLVSLSTSQARDIILLENLATHSEGQVVLKIIQNKFNIPRRLITYRNVNNECTKNSEAIMQLCVKNDGTLEVVKVNKFAVENSLRVFLEMGE